MSGSTAPLVTAAVGLGYPVRLAELARRAGITKFAASRAAASLTEIGLLAVADGGGYEFAAEHPMAETVERLAWRLNGVTRPDPDRFDRFRVIEAIEDDYRYQDLIPRSLQRGVEPRTELAQPIGPCLVEVRDWLTNSASLSRELHGYEPVAQEVYYRWHTERLRDVIHQVLHFGGALSTARGVLRAACGPTAQGDDDPWQVRISGHDWVRATYLVSAEAAGVQQLVDILLRAIDVGNQVHRERDEAIFWLEEAARAAGEDRSADAGLARATVAAAEAERLWEAPTGEGELPYRNIGGTPRPVDVGTAGDKILAVQLSFTLRRLTKTVAGMAEHPSFARWSAAAPEGEFRPVLVSPKGETEETR